MFGHMNTLDMDDESEDEWEDKDEGMTADQWMCGQVNALGLNTDSEQPDQPTRSVTPVLRVAADLPPTLLPPPLPRVCLPSSFRHPPAPPSPTPKWIPAAPPRPQAVFKQRIPLPKPIQSHPSLRGNTEQRNWLTLFLVWQFRL